jgi:hypothetical protein
MRALPYVTAWCQEVGAAPGPRATQALRDRWGDALREPFFQAVWALEKGPVHFGYTTWSLPAEVLSELQITGTVATLAAAWDGARA